MSQILTESEVTELRKRATRLSRGPDSGCTSVRFEGGPLDGITAALKEPQEFIEMWATRAGAQFPVVYRRQNGVWRLLMVGIPFG